ncbi:Tim44 domain-containing protein [Aquabacter cavernae]|uniref:Tim44 domain-containing protein n=1 Tax=Aquabacter cavernae TaxID=2496029 RepID=UPI000F8F3D4F|nr:TIM44-like domain-containing protein [Aquabacter cavernae]
MNIFKRLPAILGVFLLGAAMTIAAVDTADARKGGSVGSRGSRTYTAPPTTNTAPSAAQPIQRSATPAPGPQSAAAAAAPARGGMFGGMAGGLLGGLALGGLVGMLMGGGLGGMAGFLGLILQVALIGGVIFLAMRFFAGRRQQGPAAAGAGAPFNANGGMFGGSAPQNGPQNGPQTANRSALGGFGGMGTGMGASNMGGTNNGMGGMTPGSAVPPQQPVYQPAPNRKVRDEIGVKGEDFDAFEKCLVGVQDAFSREDHGELARLTTVEVFNFFSEELAENAQKGVRNEVSDVKLVQGDLAEAWREGGVEYATVAMRYEMRDVMRDRTTGALAAGSSEAPETVTEVWTFTRPRGGEWVLSAIQDT